MFLVSHSTSGSTAAALLAGIPQVSKLELLIVSLLLIPPFSHLINPYLIIVASGYGFMMEVAYFKTR